MSVDSKMGSEEFYCRFQKLLILLCQIFKVWDKIPLNPLCICCNVQLAACTLGTVDGELFNLCQCAIGDQGAPQCPAAFTLVQKWYMCS